MTNLAEIITLFALILQFVQGKKKKKKKNKLKRQLELETKTVIHEIVHCHVAGIIDADNYGMQLIFGRKSIKF